MMTKFMVLCYFMALTSAAIPHRVSRVAGGTNARPDQAAHYVSLWYKSLMSISPISFCGGAILNEQWILTGAYCVHSVQGPDEIIVKAGNIYYNASSETEQLFDVILAIVHPKYIDSLGAYDIALLKLQTPLKFNKFVSPIALAPANSVPSGSGTVMGFGSISHISGLIFPEILQIVSLPIIENDECKRLVGAILEDVADEIVLVDKWRFCAGPTKANQGHCLHDNGDPFTTKVNDKDVLVGLANFGFAADCTTPNAPSIYTRVSAFNSWIQETINAN